MSAAAKATIKKPTNILAGVILDPDPPPVTRPLMGSSSKW